MRFLLLSIANKQWPSAFKSLSMPKKVCTGITSCRLFENLDPPNHGSIPPSLSLGLSSVSSLLSFLTASFGLVSRQRWKELERCILY